MGPKKCKVHAFHVTAAAAEEVNDNNLLILSSVFNLIQELDDYSVLAPFFSYVCMAFKIYYFNNGLIGFTAIYRGIV